METVEDKDIYIDSNTTCSVLDSNANNETSDSHTIIEEIKLLLSNIASSSQASKSNDFSNTVWSSELDNDTNGLDEIYWLDNDNSVITNESIDDDVVIVFEDLNKTNEKEGGKSVIKEEVIELPQLETFLPTWKKIFPWMQWIPSHHAIICNLCGKLFAALSHSALSASIKQIHNQNEIFSVSKCLRDHMDSTTHIYACTLLKDRKLMSLLVCFLRWHLLEFKDIQDIQNALQVVGLVKEINDSTIRTMLQLLSQYLEDSVIKKLKNRDVEYYVIADIKEGVLVVRFLNDLIAEEHLIGSFMTSNDTCPLDYLMKLGVPLKNLVGVSMSSPCDSYSCKCQMKKSTQNNDVNFRFPTKEKVVQCFWASKLLAPIYSILKTTSRVIRNYPHIFISLLRGQQHSRKFFNFRDFNDFLDKLPKIQEVATAIYQQNGDVSIFGLLNIDGSKLEYYKYIEPALLRFLTSIHQYHKPSKIGERRNFETLHNKVKLAKNSLVELCLSLREKFLDNETYYASVVNANDVNEFLTLIDITVLEFANNIYINCGMDCVGLLECATALRTLNTNCPKELERMFSPNFTGLSVDEFTIRSELTSFFKQFDKLKNVGIYTTLQLFKNNKGLQILYDTVYLFFKRLAMLPLENPVTYSVSLYAIRIIKKCPQMSAWSQLSDIIPCILMVFNELAIDEEISGEKLFSWWEQKHWHCFVEVK